MSTHESQPEYLVISRGRWDASLPPEEIQGAIDRFYNWIGHHIDEGTMRPGQRLGIAGATVFRGKVTDGPFGESKEVIGGYWFIRAESLEEAVKLAGENPCLQCGLFYEIRPLELVRATAYDVTNETPGVRLD